MRVFVLNSGRCGSYTFSIACRHVTNYTSGHETRHNTGPRERLDYPDQHIEADLRLAWLTGPLARRYPDAFYVHLRRDPEKVAASFLQRWQTDPPRLRRGGDLGKRLWWGLGRWPGTGIAEGFAYQVLARTQPYDDDEKLDVCRLYVETVNTNITEFLRDRPYVTVDLETADRDFPVFWEAIGAVGDPDAAVAEFRWVYDQSPIRARRAV